MKSRLFVYSLVSLIMANVLNSTTGSPLDQGLLEAIQDQQDSQVEALVLPVPMPMHGIKMI